MALRPANSAAFGTTPDRGHGIEDEIARIGERFYRGLRNLYWHACGKGVRKWLLPRPSVAENADDLRDFGDWSRCAGLTEARDLRKERDLPVNVRVCFQSLQGILKFHDLPLISPNLLLHRTNLPSHPHTK